MTIEDYSKNLRGVNDGKDFNPQYLVCRLILGSDSRLTTGKHPRIDQEERDHLAGGACWPAWVRLCLEVTHAALPDVW